MLTIGRQPQTGCTRCNGLREMTNGKVQWCLRHDPAISAEDREKYGVAFEQIPELRKRMTKKGTVDVDSEE